VNLFKAYLVKYACCACESMSATDTESMLIDKLESMLASMNKPELEHSAPVADKVVEITVVKESANSDLIRRLVSYGLKVAPNLVTVYEQPVAPESESKPLVDKYVPDINKSTQDYKSLLPNSEVPYSSSQIEPKVPGSTALA
jgi:hypothetical protein